MVDKFVRCREGTFNRGREGKLPLSSPPDDSFALGLAFILKVQLSVLLSFPSHYSHFCGQIFGQEEKFLSLKFFECALEEKREQISSLESLLTLEDHSGMSGLLIWGQNVAGLTSEDLAQKMAVNPLSAPFPLF